MHTVSDAPRQNLRKVECINNRMWHHFHLGLSWGEGLVKYLEHLDTLSAYEAVAWIGG